MARTKRPKTENEMAADRLKKMPRATKFAEAEKKPDKPALRSHSKVSVKGRMPICSTPSTSKSVFKPPANPVKTISATPRTRSNTSTPMLSETISSISSSDSTEDEDLPGTSTATKLSKLEQHNLEQYGAPYNFIIPTPIPARVRMRMLRFRRAFDPNYADMRLAEQAKQKKRDATDHRKVGRSAGSWCGPEGQKYANFQSKFATDESRRRRNTLKKSNQRTRKLASELNDDDLMKTATYNSFNQCYEMDLVRPVLPDDLSIDGRKRKSRLKRMAATKFDKRHIQQLSERITELENVIDTEVSLAATREADRVTGFNLNQLGMTEQMARYERIADTIDGLVANNGMEPVVVPATVPVVAPATVPVVVPTAESLTGCNLYSIPGTNLLYFATQDDLNPSIEIQQGASVPESVLQFLTADDIPVENDITIRGEFDVTQEATLRSRSPSEMTMTDDHPLNIEFDVS